MHDMFYADPEHQPFHYPGGPARALLIHGFLGSPRELRPLAEELAAAGFHLMRWQPQGEGPRDTGWGVATAI